MFKFIKEQHRSRYDRNAAERAGVLMQTGELAPLNKPWQLIRDAVADLQLQRKCDFIEINMCLWHENAKYLSSPGRCLQCFAGASISRRLGVSLATSCTPSLFDEDTRKKLVALNEFRKGEIGTALVVLGIPNRGYSPTWRLGVTDYSSNPERFIQDMLTMADDLERELGEPDA